MFKFKDLKQIHLEITNNCQASCPMCTRNIHGGIENPLIKIESWTIDRYKKIINHEVLTQIESVYFCGNYGDPLLNNDLLEMISYSTSVNKELEIRIHTNGSLRGKSWWRQLAEVLPKNHKVIFAIDGLADTHSIYRIGTSYEKIIENAEEFINAGGIAEWAFIRFKHNEEQVNEAKQIAQKIGFQEFTMKDSSRFLLDAKFPVYDKNRQTVNYLEPSQYSEIKFIDKSVLSNYKEILQNTKVDCYAIRQREIYINAQGHLFPCCWLAMIPYQAKDELSELHTIRSEILSQYYDLIDSFGGIESLNVETRTVKEIIDSKEYQTLWDEYWNNKKLITCVRTCGVAPEIFSTPKDQFITHEELNS